METISRSEGNRNKRSQEEKNSRGNSTHLQQVGASPSPSPLSSAVHRPPFPRSLVGPEGSSPATAATSVKGEISEATTVRRPPALSSPPVGSIDKNNGGFKRRIRGGTEEGEGVVGEGERSVLLWKGCRGPEAMEGLGRRAEPALGIDPMGRPHFSH